MEYRNEVQLCGNLVGDTQWRVVDEIERLECRIAVPRLDAGKDTIECFATKAHVVKKLESLSSGKPVEVAGVLRSRYWSRGGQVASRLQLELLTLKVAK